MCVCEREKQNLINLDGLKYCHLGGLNFQNILIRLAKKFCIEREIIQNFKETYERKN